MYRRMLGVFVLVFALLLCGFPLARGVREEAIPIHTVEQLLAIGENPGASYILMEDLDLAGVAWPCPDFSGVLDGNGHALLNLTLSQPGETTELAYDGNRKPYRCHYVGLFGTMRNAQVKNLQLINVRALVETDLPCFVGGLAGYMEHCTVTDCTVTGFMELRAHDRIFGIGGLVGYGCGEVFDSRLDVTLICVDTDRNTKDEQFLGGVYSTGFINMENCNVRLDGYISEHGYVHSGGLTGMLLQYPWGWEETGHIKDNYVEGKITFFENNDDRRAYCNAFVGESLVFYEFYKGGNTSKFKRDEYWEYNKELRPDMCREPTYTQTITAPECAAYGYTTYTCTGCGYSYTDDYTLRQHTLSDWYVRTQATVEAEGILEASCTGCGALFTQTIPKSEPEPTQVPTQSSQIQPATQAPEVTDPSQPTEAAKKSGGNEWLLVFAAVTGTGALVALPFVLRKPRKPKGRYRRG